MIRQAISCDICGSEMKQNNRWFVAYDQNGELRISGWSSRNRVRPGTRHLCGHTCLHKLVDDFMAKALAVRAPAAEETGVEERMAVPDAKTTDTSLTSDAAHGEFESSARLIPTPMPILPSRPPLRMPMEMLPAQARPGAEEPAQLLDEPPSFASRNWRAEAWEREREREQRAGNAPQEFAVRRLSSSK